MKNEIVPPSIATNLRISSWGLLLAILTILFGQGLGIVFGLNESGLRANWKAAATEVRTTVYKDNDAAMTKTLTDAWTNAKRAHLHAGGMGTTALALIVLACLLGTSRCVLIAINAGLGIGGLGYSIFWLGVALRAPTLGSTSAAKESLRWLAMPTSGAFVLATVTVLVLLIGFIVRGQSNKAACSDTDQ